MNFLLLVLIWYVHTPQNPLPHVFLLVISGECLLPFLIFLETNNCFQLRVGAIYDFKNYFSFRYIFQFLPLKLLSSKTVYRFVLKLFKIYCYRKHFWQTNANNSKYNDTFHSMTRNIFDLFFCVGLARNQIRANCSQGKRSSSSNTMQSFCTFLV